MFIPFFLYGQQILDVMLVVHYLVTITVFARLMELAFVQLDIFGMLVWIEMKQPQKNI
jgi:hypothetical protein